MKIVKVQYKCPKRGDMCEFKRGYNMCSKWT